MGKTTCKRCGAYPSLTDPFHRGFGARSRTDNKTMICSECGVEEAIVDFCGGYLHTKDEWPIKELEQD